MSFDPESILDISIEESNSTEVILIPETDEILGLIESEKSIEVKQYNNAETGKTTTVLNVTYLLDDEELKKLIGRDKPMIRQSVFIDLTEDGRIDTADGRNVGLGLLREAIGKNEGAFSFRDLVGQVLTLRIKHREDKDGVTRAEVRSVKAA